MRGQHVPLEESPPAAPRALQHIRLFVGMAQMGSAAFAAALLISEGLTAQTWAAIAFSTALTVTSLIVFWRRKKNLTNLQVS